MEVELTETSGTPAQARSDEAARALLRKQGWYALLGCSILQLPIWGIVYQINCVYGLVGCDVLGTDRCL